MQELLAGFPTYAATPSNGEPAADTLPRRSRGDSAQLAGKHVVIVEDEGITQIQLRRVLTAAGLVVVGIAGNGAAGVETVLREKPDIVLMDVKMPGEFDGLEAARRILASFSTCVVMLTAFGDYEEEAFAIGAAGYVVKPVDSQTLVPKLIDAYSRNRPQ